MSRRCLISVVILILSGSLGPAVAAAGGESPGAVVDRFLEAYRSGSAEGMLALYADDAVFEDVNQRHTYEGTDQLRRMTTGLVSIHHRMGLVEKRRVVDGDTVVVEHAYVGQLDGAVLGASVGKEGCPDLSYELPATSWFRVRQGRIVEQKDFIDWATFLDLRQQMLAAGKDAAAADGARDAGSH